MWTEWRRQALPSFSSELSLSCSLVLVAKIIQNRHDAKEYEFVRPGDFLELPHQLDISLLVMLFSIQISPALKQSCKRGQYSSYVRDLGVIKLMLRHNGLDLMTHQWKALMIADPPDFTLPLAVFFESCEILFLGLMEEERESNFSPIGSLLCHVAVTLPCSRVRKDWWKSGRYTALV